MRRRGVRQSERATGLERAVGSAYPDRPGEGFGHGRPERRRDRVRSRWPGASGVDFVRETEGQIGDATLQSHYDIVGIDPRGVGHSTAVECYSSSRLGHFYFDNRPGPTGSEQWIDATIAADRDLAAACIQKTGALLRHVGTADAARDLDVVRAVLGEKKLNYLGYSYGTDLGLTYAGLFPSHVGRFVLDAVDDPSLTGEQLDVQQAAGFEDELHHYLTGCLVEGAACPFSGSEADTESQLTALFAKVEAEPIADAGRKLNGDNLAQAVISALYDPQDWPLLTQAIGEVRRGIATTAFVLADYYVERDSDGTYPNMIEAYDAVSCQDAPFPDTPSELAEETSELRSVAPVLGPYLAYQGAICAYLPASSAHPTPVTAAGSGPIVLVSATHDDATPHQWAVAVDQRLADGHLITRNGDGHTSYPGSSACVDAAVDAYFLSGTVPPDGQTC